MHYFCIISSFFCTSSVSMTTAEYRILSKKLIKKLQPSLLQPQPNVSPTLQPQPNISPPHLPQSNTSPPLQPQHKTPHLLNSHNLTSSGAATAFSSAATTKHHASSTASNVAEMNNSPNSTTIVSVKNGKRNVLSVLQDFAYNTEKIKRQKKNNKCP